jgi:hypothetical protein
MSYTVDTEKQMVVEVREGGEVLRSDVQPKSYPYLDIPYFTGLKGKMLDIGVEFELQYSPDKQGHYAIPIKDEWEDDVRVIIKKAIAAAGLTTEFSHKRKPEDDINDCCDFLIQDLSKNYKITKK